MSESAPRKIITIHDEREAARHAMGRIMIIDDDEAIRKALAALLEFEGYAAIPVESASAYLEIIDRDEPVFPGPSCILLDVKMPGLTGLELQSKLLAMSEITPIIFMSGGSGASEAVSALRNGAIDFLIKPFEDEDLLTAVSLALNKSRALQQSQMQNHELASRISALSEREIQVAKMVSAGMLNRDIAAQLSIAVRTVKLHRMHMMRKLGATNVIELARMLDRLS